MNPILQQLFMKHLDELSSTLEQGKTRTKGIAEKFDKNLEDVLGEMVDNVTSTVFEFDNELKLNLEASQLQKVLDQIKPPETPRPRPVRDPADREESRRQEESRKGIPGVGSTGDFFKRYFLMVLTPLVTFATVLNQTTSGFRMFLGSVNILAATLAPILLPGFVLLAAAVLALSDKIWAEMVPALADFYKWVFSHAVPALSTFVDWLFRAVDGVADFIKGLEDIYDVLNAPGGAEVLGRNLAEMMQNDGLGGNFLLPFAGLPGLALGALGGGIDRNGGQMMAPGQRPLQIGGIAQNIPNAGPDGKRGGLSPEFLKALREVTREMTFQQQPQAQMTSLAQASRAAQLAAVGQSPFEQKMLERQTKTVQALDQAVSWLERIHRDRGGLQ